MGLPFLICSLALNKFLAIFQKNAKHIGIITKIGGALLVLVGILLLTDSLSYLSELFNRWIPSF
jgi:cytochrome c-type biogenesis protein